MKNYKLLIVNSLLVASMVALPAVGFAKSLSISADGSGALGKLFGSSVSANANANVSARSDANENESGKADENKNEDSHADVNVDSSLSATLPVISNFAAKSVKKNQVKITWNTDVRANSSLWISTNSTVDTSAAATVSRPGMIKKHKIVLNHLLRGTTYYVVVGSTDSAGNTLSSAISFTTKGKPVVPPVVDTVAPVVAAHADVNAVATSSAGAVVNYTAPAVTDNVDTSITAVCTPASGSTFAIGTTKVTCDATDKAGNKAVQTSFNVIVTADVTAPVISGTQVTVNSTGGTIAWTTDEKATSQVFISTKTPVDAAASDTMTFSSSASVTAHSLNISGLAPATLYHFIVKSVDGSGNVSVSSESTFTTTSS